MVICKRRFGRKRIHEFEACLGTESHPDRYCTIQLDDRGRDELCELIVKLHNARPVRLFGDSRSRVASCDCSLNSVWASLRTEFVGTLEG